MDSIINTFEIKKKIFLQGDFSGKYEANQFTTLSNCNLSKINILGGKLDNVQKCDFNNLFNIQSESLHHQDGFNVELKLDDELLKDKYVFIEEFNNSTIYDITLSDHQIDDNDIPDEEDDCSERPADLSTTAFYDEKVDIWAAGCLLYQMIEYVHPFSKF